MQKVLLTTLILSSSLMIAMESNNKSQQEHIDWLADYFGIPSDCKITLLTDEKIKLNYTWHEEFNSARTEFLEENLRWRVKEVLDANERVKPESMDTAQKLIREACTHCALTGSLVKLLDAGVDPHTSVEGLLSPKEIASRHCTFALWILEEYDKKGTFKPDTSKE